MTTMRNAMTLRRHIIAYREARDIFIDLSTPVRATSDDIVAWTVALGDYLDAERALDNCFFDHFAGHDRLRAHVIARDTSRHPWPGKEIIDQARRSISI